jgi:hypothetical protein
MPRQSFVQQYINGEWVMVPKEQFNNARAPKAAYVIPDIQPYKSTIDGSVIGSRSTHRAHLKQHGCIEIGNEKQKPYTPPPLPSRVDDIKRAISEAKRKGLKMNGPIYS